MIKISDTVVGETNVEDKKTNKLLNVLIKRDNSYKPGERYRAYLLNSETCLGQIALVLLSKSGSALFSKNPRLSKIEYGRIYYGKQKLISKIFVNYIDSLKNDKYRLVGTRLMQVAMEISYIKKCNGCVQCMAIDNSHGFYYKLGMRVQGGLSKKINSLIKKELENAKKENRKANTNRFFYNNSRTYMYLPKVAIDKWKKVIKFRPILYDHRSSW